MSDLRKLIGKVFCFDNNEEKMIREYKKEDLAACVKVLKEAFQEWLPGYGRRDMHVLGVNALLEKKITEAPKLFLQSFPLLRYSSIRKTI